MQLTKTLEKDILNNYNIWLDSYLNGDVTTYDSYFDDAYHFIGSTNNEEFLTRKATTKFFKKTAEQLAGKTDLRNEIKTIELFDKLVFITHAFDAWFLNGKDWAYYGRFRFSSVMQKKEKDWKFIYQHFSTTDSKTDNGETIGFDKVNLENQELREAIKRRTFELEEKNRALEIEGALERIRSRVTALQESSDLFDIVVTMRNEFLSLGHEADYFWHMKWTKDNYEMSMTAEDGGRLGMVITVPKFVHEEIKSLHKWEKGNSPYFVLALNGKEAWKYIDKMNTYGKYQQVDPHAPTEEDILHIGGLTFIIARTTHGEIGFSLAGKVDKPPKASIDILVRFASVFDLAYMRFEDLQNSEAQARETQIELALEKVRSRTMAMQHSNELQETSFLLDEQIRALGIKTWGCAFNIYGDKASTEWFGNEAGVLPTYTVPHKGIFKKYYQKGHKGESFFIQEFSGKACIDHYEYMSTLPVIGDVLKTLKKTNKGFPNFQIDHVAYFKYGYLLFITKEHVPESHEVFKRFAKVFEQTYTRFLDLKKAEAQAKEAQIEMALERVRSRSMAMHNSKEIGDVAFVLFQQLKSLGGELWGTGFGFCKEDSGTDEFWFANEKGIMPHLKIPNTVDPAHKKMYQGWKKNLEFISIEKGGKELKEHYKYMLTVPDVQPIFQGILDQNEAFPKWQKWHAAYFKYGYMLVITTENYENEVVFNRFAKVFEQAYIRFLDLQKAEAQAREAQIETALERVRSRSIGMYKSEELAQVVLLLDEELIGLGVEVHGTQILTDFDNPENNVKVWFGMKGQDYLERFHVPYFDHPIRKNFHSAWKKGVDFFTEQYSKTDKNKFIRLLFKNSDFRKASKERQKFIYDSPGLTRASVLFKNSILIFQRYNLSEFSDEEVVIFKRFSKVFEQAYTRFLDLQKAEAQAKEAQIEMALEKVRSRTMAMQHSEELPEAANVLFKEIQNLGIPAWSCGYNILSEDKKSSTCFMSSEGEIQAPFVLPFTKHKSLRFWHKALLNYEPFFVHELGGEDLVAHYDFMQSLPDLKETFQQLREADISLPTFQVNHLAKFTNGFLLFITYERVPDAHEIFQRFAKVFNQTYTRFLDLEKAEAQTREAQINLAVERVRAKALAMHKSEEIMEVVAKLKDEVMSLDIPDVVAATIFLKEGDDQVRMWDLSTLEKNNNGYQIPFDITFKLKKKDPYLYVKRVWENPDDYFLELQEAKDFKRIIAWLRENNKEAIADEVEEYTETTKLKQLHHAVKKLNSGKLVIDLLNPPTDEMKSILTKMGAAFDLAYKRFEDLQKAEAQAREAQIEMALEKVRSRTMAMQHSDELPEAANTLFHEIQRLGIPSWSCGFNILSKDKKSSSSWMSSEGQIQKPFKLLFEKEASFIEMYNFFKSDDVFLLQELDGKAIESHYNYLKSLPGLDTIFDELKSKGIPHPTYQINHLCKFNNGYLLFITYEKVPEAHELFKRFTNVFEQTYTRFLDLQNAESLKRKAEEDLVKLQKAKRRAEAALSELKTTQSQLIQSEKMASLGELTAGIAHEIQNPLNFVNNFSEVSNELIDEMNEEIDKGDLEEAKFIAKDIKQNLEKINHHGKRADAIVKGILQHSRSSNAQKELTDINKLADEYFRLAYHGLRAKDKKFNATLATDYDDNIGNIAVIPQDIGRVILNLITNAFYAVDEKKKSGITNYEPTVSVSTKQLNDQVIISVKDNGNGIPKHILDKIYQPFFTTKPTGQGTGLGLSMSYDIVVAHGGELKAETKEGEGTTFIIKLLKFIADN